MELTKHDSQMAKGIAIIGMVMLHLFCRSGELPYLPLIWIGKIPLIYYLGLLGDMCVPIFCFCSGYAHFLLNEELGKQYKKRIPGKLARFMCNYWIVLILFSIVGLAFNKHDIIPQSINNFLGNMFLYNMSYNGAWWFVLTYVILLLLSPMLAYVIKETSTLMPIIVSSGIYFVAYLLRYKILIELSPQILDWILDQSILVGTSQYGYIIGMCFRKNRWIGRLRNLFTEWTYLKKAILTIVVPLLVLLSHCFAQSVFFAPFTAITTLVALFLIKTPKKIDAILAFLGKHSTNIWLIHMFFYVSLFNGFVFRAKYPVLIVSEMFALCIVTSFIINMIYVPICNWVVNKKWV